MRRILLTTMVAVIGALIASQTWADDAEIAKEIRNGLKSLQQKGKLTGFSINIKVLADIIGDVIDNLVKRNGNQCAK